MKYKDSVLGPKHKNLESPCIYGTVDGGDLGQFSSLSRNDFLPFCIPKAPLSLNVSQKERNTSIRVFDIFHHSLRSFQTKTLVSQVTPGGGGLGHHQKYAHITELGQIYGVGWLGKVLRYQNELSPFDESKLLSFYSQLHLQIEIKGWTPG